MKGKEKKREEKKIEEKDRIQCYKLYFLSRIKH